MADVSDVAEALAQIVADAAYPNGTGQPSVSNGPIIVYPGWPDPDSLDADLAAGKVHVSIFPRPGDTITSIMMGDIDWSEDTNNGLTGTASREVRRQAKQFQITIWAPTPPLRDVVAAKVDAALAVTSRIAMPDGSHGVVSYVNMTQIDAQQKSSIYRRDLFYSVNYAIVQTQVEYAILHVLTNVAAGPTADDPELLASRPIPYVQAPPYQPPLPSILLENGGHLLTEAGGRILLEA